MLILTTYLSGDIIAEGGTLEPVDPIALYDVIDESAACNDLLIITHIKAPIQAWLEWAFNTAFGKAITYSDELIQQSAAILIDVHPAIQQLGDVATIAQAQKNGLVRFYWIVTAGMASTEAISTDVLADPDYQPVEASWTYAPRLFA